ncbi:hypothetical protein BUE80_DR007807 [Diplocarpon rosae]|nr:hypothetical protein BUE80_DR007807 [Diplocarpon rosae]
MGFNNAPWGQGREKSHWSYKSSGNSSWTAIKDLGLGNALVLADGTEKYVDHYVKREDERSYIQSWSSNNHALEKGECLIEDSTLDELLDARSVKPTAVEETLEEILKH